MLFDGLAKHNSALINIDDPNGKVMVQNSQASIYTYALRRPAKFKGKVISNELSGLHMDIEGKDIFLKMVGGFNAYNAIAVYGTGIALGLEEQDVLRELSMLVTAEGRLDMISKEGVSYTAVVDYAHTPDALDKVIKTLVEVKKDNVKLITVVGCGGDRDKTKRPKMAQVAATKSDILILTSDNPRTEDPEPVSYTHLTLPTICSV